MSIARDPDFYLQQANYVRSLARRLVYDRHAADDLFQAAWLAALQRPPHDTTSPRRWLASIVRNLASKAWLRARRREQREANREGPTPPSSPSDVLEHEQERQRLVAALLELDEPYRAALIARFFDGLEPAAIAARDGVPVETVRTRIKRGLERLRERLLRGGASAAVFAKSMSLGEPDATAVFGRFLRGVLLMTATKKVVVAAAVVVLAVAGWWTVHLSRETAAANATRGGAVVAPPSAPPDAAVAAPAPASTPTLRDAGVERIAPVLEATGALAIVVQWADGRPAAGIAVRAGATHTSNFEVSAVAARTDRDGRVRFAAMVAGETFVECDRGARRACTVRAGACTDVVLTIERGVRVRGRVLDIDGRPAAGAEIHQLFRFGAAADDVVARADAEGTFVVEDAPAERRLGFSARLPQRAPTAQKIVAAAAGAVVDVELQFAARGGAIAGRIVDATGAAVARATVLVGADGNLDALRVQRSPDESPPRQAWHARSDANGEWLLDGIATGDTPVLVVAPGMAPWDAQVHVVEAGLVRCDAVLVAGASLAGAVHDERGAPVANAAVQVGQFGLRAAFTKSAADGTFSLSGLPIGAFTVVAKADGAGGASTDLVGVAGVALRWDAVLARALTLRGRVVAANGPVAGAQVFARCMESAQQQWFGEATTDANGAFTITNCADALLHLDVRTPAGGIFVVAAKDDVDPKVGEVVLEVDPAREPSAFCTGRVVDPDGRPVVGAEVVVLPTSLDIGGGHTVRTGDDGRFTTPGCPPGEWYGYVNAPGWPQVGWPRRTVTAGATVDFGDLQLVRGHAVIVTLQPEAGVDITGLVVGLADANCGIATLEPANGVVRFPNVAPGEYTLTAYAPGIALRPVPLRVGAEPETALALPIAAGSEVTVEVRDERDQPVVDRLETELFDAAGACIDRTPITPASGPLAWKRRLVAGRYELRLQDHRAHVATVSIAVAPGGAPVRLIARLR